MYNVQVISRAPWDGLNNMAPDPNELGWKETIRVSPLEDTYIALRPVNATVPFAVPDNVRAIDPTMPLGVTLAGPPGGFFDTAANGITVPNHLVNFGWEYVWHCHILSHEEMDMMHSQAISVNDPGAGPTNLMSGEVHNATTNTVAVFLVWNDTSTQETDWLIQRSNISQSNWTDFMTVPSYTKTLTGGTAMAIDNSIPANTVPNYSYRVLASNVVGDDFVYAAPSVGFPTVMRNSSVSNVNISQNIALPGAVTFGATPTSGDAPLNVSFTGTSSGATGWSWDFGDGNWAGDNGMQNPNHVYQLPGAYTVTLTAMTTGGNTTSTQSTTITVSQTLPPAVPVARFTANQTSGIAPLAVSFDATTSTSAPAIWATWRWSFGDGTFSSLQNPTHTYVAGGNYTVSLVAMNLGGTSAPAIGSINVTTVAPVANFTATPTTGRVPLTVVFTDLSTNVPTTWNWTFGDGNVTNATMQNPVHVYRTVGNYTVSLNASNSGGTGTMTKVGYINVSSAVLGTPFGVGVYRQADHTFYLKNGTTTTAINWGISTDLPVTGDWNGNGITDVGIYRPADHTFYLKNGTTTAINWGISTDLPVTGDWNRDGITDVGVYRQADHTFYLKNGTTTAINWGISTDLPVTGDWNGDGMTDVGIYRPADHTFYLKNGTTTAINWGISTDLPVTGRWI
jgi:PKD repeat protein